MREPETQLLCGREFDAHELAEIVDIVRMFRRLSRAELAVTVCENLGCVAPNGRLKLESCLQALEKLEAQGRIRLAAKDTTRIHRRKESSPAFTPATGSPPVVAGKLRPPSCPWRLNLP